MATGKKSFLLYCDLIHKIEHLTTDEKGQLFEHLLAYVNDRYPVLENRILIGVWKPIELQLKADLKLWEKKQKQRSQAGRRSAEARKQKLTDSTTVNDRSIRSTKSTVNVNVNVYNSYIEELRNHFKSNAKYFYKQFPTLQSSKGHLKYLLDEFEGHVMTEDNSDKTEFADWMRHFKNWVTIKVKNGYGLN